MTTEVYLCDQEGVRIDCLDYLSELEYCKVSNDIAPFRVKLPAKFDRSKIYLDNIIEIWQGFGPGTLKNDYCGFPRAWRKADEAGSKYTELYGFDSKDLLRSRTVEDYGGTAKSYMNDEADNVIKAIARNELGASAAAGRSLTSVGGGFTVQADLSDAPVIVKGFQFRKVLDVFQEIADTSTQLGTRLYFDVVPDFSSAVTGKIAFQLRTYTDQRGDDRTWDSFSPVFVGNDLGELPKWEYRRKLFRRDQSCKCAWSR